MDGIPVTIVDLLRERAEQEPDRVALRVDGVGSMSYRAWEERSNAVARGLVARGVEAGEPLALFFDDTEWREYAVAYLAALKAGAIAVPLSDRLTDTELASILSRCGAAGTIHHAHTCLTRWNAAVSELEDGRSTAAFGVPITGDRVAEVVYTSGTTGLPKGVACRHTHLITPLVADSGWPPHWWRSCDGGVFLHANALSSAGGQLRLFEPLSGRRMTTVSLPRFDPERFCELVEEHRVQVVQLVPAMANAILISEAYQHHDLSSVRVVSLGCAPLPPPLIPRLAAAFDQARLVNLYELSEARHAGTAQIHDGSRPESVGRPRGATEIRIVDASGEPAAPRIVGEVWMRWRGLEPQHYFRDLEATAQVFVDGWTRTGDAGWTDEDGYLYLSDRIKDVIIKGGLNIATVEVENVLLEHPAITECAVFGTPDDIQGEEVAAAIVATHPIPLADLHTFLLRKLPVPKLPRRLLWLDELPRNRSAKVAKDELRRRLPAP